MGGIQAEASGKSINENPEIGSTELTEQQEMVKLD